MSEIKLLPCPFCGGEAEFYRATIKSNGGWCDSVVVRCKECEARTNRVLYNKQKHGEDGEYKEASEVWNTRKPMERIVERLEDLRAKPTETVYDTILVGSVIEIVKEEGGIE